MEPGRSGKSGPSGSEKTPGGMCRFTKLAAVAAGTFMAMGVAESAMADSGAEAIASRFFLSSAESGAVTTVVPRPGRKLHRSRLLRCPT